MGEVYKAYDPTFDRTVALKMIVPGGQDKVFLERLYREAKALGRIGQKGHPHIVNVFDMGEADGTVFIAMQFLEGDNLGAAIQRGTLTFEAKLSILMQVLDALQFAHNEGVVHRDIKPTNIFLLPDNTVKLLDFGLARVAQAEALTLTGDVMGTPYYMAPEQLKGQAVDHRADVFSTGVVAYELMTHRRAFDGQNVTEVILKVLSDPPPPMETGWSAKFPEIERIVGRAMAKSAHERYATADDMRTALAAFLASSRDRIAQAQADAAITSRRAVAEAKTLLASGHVAESQALLADTLRSIPEAQEVRQLRDETLRTAPADVAPESTALLPGRVSSERTDAAQSPRLPSAAEQRARPVNAPPANPAVTPAGLLTMMQGDRARWVLPVVGVVAGLVIAILVAQMLGVSSGDGASKADADRSPETPPARAALSTANPPSSAAVAPAPAPSPEPVVPPEASTRGATGSIGHDVPVPRPGPSTSRPSNTSLAPSNSPPAPAAALPPARPGGDRSARPPSPQPPLPAQTNPGATAVSVTSADASAGGDAQLSSLLAQKVASLLRDQGVRPAGPVRLSLQMTVRDSGFAGTTARTADWVATVLSPPPVRTFQGRLLDFSELTLRNKAVDAAAGEVVAALATR
jgi:serine/threonine-protein kinase